MEQPYETDDGTVVCHNCEAEYERIGYHWSNGSCRYPDIPTDKDELITGLMLGDGTLRTHTNEPFVQTYMINEPFLEWVDTELDWLSTGVSLYRTAERSAELSRGNGYPNADSEDYHDVYVVQTRTMPQFRDYESWYNGDGKRFPSYLVLTPRIMAVWYACDGSLNWDRRYPGARPHITIGASNEMDNIDNVLRMFNQSTFPHEPRVDTNTIRFSVEETEDLLDWMGDPLPGFEYKWCLDSLDSYTGLKNDVLGDS